MGPESALVIRADADVQIGTGHVMRCLALAQAWADRAGTVTLVSSETLPPALRERYEVDGSRVRVITALPGSAADADQTIAFAREVDAVSVVVDGYIFGSDYQQHIKNAGLHALFVDDYGHADHYVADIVLNQNVGATESLYGRRESYTQLLLGTRYTLLRREFWRWRGALRNIPSQAAKLLITIGGSDPDNVTAFVLRALERITPVLDVVVVVGGGNPHGDALHAMAKRSRQRVQLQHSVQDMPALMAWADLAVSAGGSTVWELAYMGLPSILVVTAENQRPIAEEMARQKIVLALGSPPEAADIASCVTDLIYNETMRASFSRAGQVLVDGYGSARGVNALRRQAPPLQLRPVDASDALLIWKWANDPVTRANSFHPEPISWEAHLSWYASKLQSSSTRLWRLEVGGVPVAHIRYERINSETAEISYTVGPDDRGKGYGTLLLTESWQLACRELDVRKVQGITFETNLASIKAFEKAGFVLSGRMIEEGHACAVFSRQYSDMEE